MAPEVLAIEVAVNALVDEYRNRGLWFLRADWYPATHEERLRVLSQIERRADAAGFRRARSLSEWLSLNSSAASVG